MFLTLPDIDELKQAIQEFQLLQREFQYSLNNNHQMRQPYLNRDCQLNLSKVPWIAVHYSPLAPIPLSNAEQLWSLLKVYAMTNKGFPTASTSDKLIFIIDAGASITVTNNKVDFFIRAFSGPTYQSTRHCGWIGNYRYWGCILTSVPMALSRKYR